MTSAPIVSKVWSFCNTLRDDGVGYGDYLEQLTYLIFLKIPDQYAQPPYKRDVGIPAKYTWPSRKAKRGAIGHFSPVSRVRHRHPAIGSCFCSPHRPPTMWWQNASGARLK